MLDVGQHMLSNISKEELLVGVPTSAMVCLLSLSCSSEYKYCFLHRY